MKPIIPPLVRELVRAIDGNERALHLLTRLLGEMDPALAALVPPPAQAAPALPPAKDVRQDSLFAEPKSYRRG